MTWANGITLSRIVAIPLFFSLWFGDHYTAALVLLTIALLSDFIDGKVARMWNQESPLGALLDPVADKAIVISFFSYLYLQNTVPLWFFALVMARNISQLLSIPILNWLMRISFKVKPKPLPKLATAVSFVLLWLMFVTLASGKELLGAAKPFVEATILSILIGSALMELYILMGYLPRFYQIAVGTHDTFE